MRADFIHSSAFALRAIVLGRILLVGMFVAASLPSIAQDAASQLETIKAEVLNAAVAGGVSVVSSAYINGDGQLIESSFYRTDGGIRGIRMQALLEDQNEDVHAGYIETSPLNPNLSCDQLPPPRYGRSLTQSFVLLDQVKEQGKRHVRELSEVSTLVQAAVSTEINTSSRWSLLSVRESDKHAEEPASLYTRFTDGSFIDPRNSNTELRVTVIDFSPQELNPAQTLRAGRRGLKRLGSQLGAEFGLGIDRSVLAGSRLREGMLEVSLILSLVEIDSGETEIARQPITLKIALRDGQIANADRMQGQIASATESLLARGQATLRCQPESLVVYSQLEFSDATPTLNQGASVGVRRGDRFLLSTRKFTDAEQLLDSEMLESLSIAEVVRVNPHNAELQILEGPTTVGLYKSALPF
ncbi:MAG: hypothetical protein ISQ56_07430 [Pseudomonadales bacterium]|nr:hypothetical protein [Pseudomonadales bacterium]